MTPRNHRRRPVVEGLEARCLLAVTLSEFPVPMSNSGLSGITAGPDGDLWFVEQKGGKIGQINPATHAVAEFAIPPINSFQSTLADAITAGPDGNLWFTANVFYNSEGNFFLPPAGLIGEISPVTHVVTQFPIGAATGGIGGIAAGPDGNLWFTEPGAHKIGMINPLTHVITEFTAPPFTYDLTRPLGITAGPDGNLWFIDNVNRAGTINPTTHAISEFAIPPVALPTSFSGGITAGPDGDLWFIASADLIGRINPVTHAVAEFPTLTPAAVPAGITAGPDGDLWFTEYTAGKVGEIDPKTLAVTEYPVPRQGILPNGIAAGPDGNLWFTNYEGDTIGKVQIAEGPKVLSLRRYGYHALPTRLVLTFNAPLDPARAQDPNNYRLAAAGRDRRFGTPDDVAIPVRSAAYDPSTHSVTLAPAQRLALRDTYQLTVNGSSSTGLTDPVGNALDGAGNGTVGSDYVALIDRHSLAGAVVRAPRRPGLSGVATKARAWHPNRPQN